MSRRICRTSLGKWSFYALMVHKSTKYSSMTASELGLERSMVINCDGVFHQAGALGVYIFKHEGGSITDSLNSL